MSKRQLTFSILFLIPTFLSGCLPPTRYTISPGASGTVADAQDNNPIKGAVVLFEASSVYAKPERQVITTTNDRGEFSISANQEWGVYAGPESPRLTGFVKIQASGYKETTKEFGTFMISGPANLKLGVILLERSQ